MNRLVIGSYNHSFLLHLMRADLAGGFLLVDPTGELAIAMANATPPSEMQRTFLFEPFDQQHPAAFNIFSQLRDDQHQAITEQFCAFFDAVFPQGANTLTRMNASYILALSVRVLLAKPDATLAELVHVITDKTYRSKLLSLVSDEAVRAGWQYIDRQSMDDPRWYPSQIAPLLAKLGGIMLSPSMRGVLGDPRSTFSLSQDKIVLANLDRRLVGDYNAKLLGLLLISRAQCPVYINNLEFFSTEYMPTLFARSGFTVAGRTLPHYTQYPGLREALLGFDAHYVFRVTSRDADELTHVTSAMNPRQLTSLAPGAYQTISGEHEVPSIPRYGRIKAIRKRSWARHSRPHARRG